MTTEELHKTVKTLSVATILMLTVNAGLVFYSHHLSEKIDNSALRATQFEESHRRIQVASARYVEQSRQHIRDTRRLLKEVERRAIATACDVNNQRLNTTTYAMPRIRHQHHPYHLHEIESVVDDTSEITYHVNECPPHRIDYRHDSIR